MFEDTYFALLTSHTQKIISFFFVLENSPNSAKRFEWGIHNNEFEFTYYDFWELTLMFHKIKWLMYSSMENQIDGWREHVIFELHQLLRGFTYSRHWCKNKNKNKAEPEIKFLDSKFSITLLLMLTLFVCKSKSKLLMCKTG